METHYAHQSFAPFFHPRGYEKEEHKQGVVIIRVDTRVIGVLNCIPAEVVKATLYGHCVCKI